MTISVLPRPVMVGEANPYGGDPEYALYPAPDGCSGQRLCCLVLGMHRRAYLDSFERVNLCLQEWNLRDAREAAAQLLQRQDTTRFVLLGAKVCSAFKIPYKPLLPATRGDGKHRALVLPHPSGLCRLWNQPGYFLKARAAVAQFCPEVVPLLGTVDGGSDAHITRH